MSDYLKPTLYKGKGLENQLRNCMYNQHDLICGCNSPRLHLTSILNPKECRSTERDGFTHDDTEKQDIPIEEGDLSALFELTDDAAG